MRNFKRKVQIRVKEKCMENIYKQLDTNIQRKIFEKVTRSLIEILDEISHILEDRYLFEDEFIDLYDEEFNE